MTKAKFLNWLGLFKTNNKHGWCNEMDLHTIIWNTCKLHTFNFDGKCKKTL